MLSDTNLQKYQMAALNHAGNSNENPIRTLLNLEIHYHHAPGETIKKCWVQSDAVVFFDLTPLVVTHDAQTWKVPIVTGTHLKAGTPPKFNKIIWTTSNGFSLVGVYVALIPVHQILLDGYDAQLEDEPLLLHTYTVVPAQESDYDYPYD